MIMSKLTATEGGRRMRDIVNFEDLNESHLKVARDIVAVDPKKPNFREAVRIMVGDMVGACGAARSLPPDLLVVIDSTDPFQLRELKEKVG
jgi:hypothetical protein